jgi:hypothetical protein
MNKNDKLEVILKRYDGQVYGIEREDDGMFRSVVPSDVAEQGYGFPHGDRGDAERYLKEVIAECEKPLSLAEISEWIGSLKPETRQSGINMPLKIVHSLAQINKNLVRYDHLRETGGAIWYEAGTQNLATNEKYDEYVDNCIKAKKG